MFRQPAAQALHAHLRRQPGPVRRSRDCLADAEVETEETEEPDDAEDVVALY